MTKRKQYTVAVDVDGVLAEYTTWQGWRHIGEPIDGATYFMQWLREQGMYIIIHTTRMAPYINPTATQDEVKQLLADWLNKNDMPFDEIWTGEGKPYAEFYVDDRAVVCRPQYSDRPEDAFSAAIVVIKMRIAKNVARFEEKEEENVD